MFELLRLRLLKAVFALVHPVCWPALIRGVAPSVEHRQVLSGLACDLVLDVGANRGQFTLMARLLQPSITVHAYEPLPTAAKVFQAIHQRDKRVSLHQLALGDQPGTADLHVSGQADSSSLLPIGELQSRFYPQTAEVGTSQVKVATLDSLSLHWGSATRALLKLDVQGYELQVLRGAANALKNCAYVYAECSEVPLYSGQALRGEVESFLCAQGFRLQARFNPVFGDGKLIQADYLFSRLESKPELLP